MGKRNEDIDNGIWADPDFDRLSPNAALMYLWSFTNPRCGMSGMYRIGRRHILEGKLEAGDRDEALKELVDARYVLFEDEVLWVRTRARYLRQKGSKMLRAIETDLEVLPKDHSLIDAFKKEYEGTWVAPILEGFGKGSRRVPESSALEPKVGTLPEVPEGVPVKGKGVKGLSKKVLKKDWNEWIEDFHSVTGRVSISGSLAAQRAFAARRNEGHTLEDLKAATAGCHSDAWRVEKGRDTPDIILRASEVEGYISQARDVRKSTGSPGMDNARRLADRIKAKQEARAAA